MRALVLLLLSCLSLYAGEFKFSGGTGTNYSILQPDLFMEHPNGVERIQYFKVISVDVVPYKKDGKLLYATNSTMTTNIVSMDMVRGENGWTNKIK